MLSSFDIFMKIMHHKKTKTSLGNKRKYNKCTDLRPIKSENKNEEKYMKKK